MEAVVSLHWCSASTLKALVCVASVPLAIRVMGKSVLSLVSVQLTMAAVTHWHAAWITLVSVSRMLNVSVPVAMWDPVLAQQVACLHLGVVAVQVEGL